MNRALANGRRGLIGGTTLARFLADRRRSKRYHLDLPRITPEKVLAWADAHHRRNGAWPTAKSGPTPDTDLAWQTVDRLLYEGGRGLAGGSSLARLLATHRGVPNVHDRPRLTPALILDWARKHHERTGRWPVTSSGPIPDAQGDTWAAIHIALKSGARGLPGGWSLARLRDWPEGPPPSLGPRLTLNRIQSWMHAHHTRTPRHCRA